MDAIKELLRRWGAAALLFFIPAMGSLAVPLPGAAQEEVRLQDSRVAIYNLAGEVEIVRGGGSDVVVQITRGGSDGQRLEVTTIQANGRESLVIRYPHDRIIYSALGRSSRTQMRVRPDGTFGDGGGSRGEEVEIRGSGSGLEAWADLRISVPSGKVVAVYLGVGEAVATDVTSDLRMDTGSGAVRARGITGELKVDTGSGSVVVEDVRGNLMVDTGSGDVDVRGVEGNEVRLDTGSGSVEVTGVTASLLEVDTGSGGVVLARISAPDVTVDTGSGEVRVELLADVDDLVIDTGSGEVVLRVPAGLGAEVEVDTGSGGIDLDISLEIRQVRRNYIRGVIGDGRGRIRVDTGSGGVRLIGG